MKLYREIGVDTYVFNHKVVKDDIKNFSKYKILKEYQHLH